MSDTLKARGIAAVVWDFFGKIAKHATTIIVTAILARLLEPSAFGLIAMVMVIVMMAMIFTDIGLGAALIQRRHTLPIHYSSVFYFNLAIGTTLTLLSFFSAEWISEFYNNEQLIDLTRTISLLFIINAFSSVQSTKLRKELNYKALAQANVFSSMLSGIIGISLAFLGADVWSLVAQQLCYGIFYNFFLWKASKWIPSLLFSFKALSQLWGYGFRMFLSAFLNTIFSRLDILIIGKLFTPATLGYFDQAKRLDSMIVQYSSGSLMAVMFPLLSKVQRNLAKFQTIALKTYGMICFIIFLILGIMFLISEELIVLLFSEKWKISASYFQLLLLSGFGYPVSSLLVNILSSRGNSKLFLKLEIYKKIIQTINFGIAFSWGVMGYLYGLIIVTFIGVGLNIKYAAEEINLPYSSFIQPLVTQMCIAIISVLMSTLIFQNTYFHDIIALVLKSTFFTICYLFINHILHTFSYEQVKKELVPIIKRKIGKC